MSQGADNNPDAAGQSAASPRIDPELDRRLPSGAPSHTAQAFPPSVERSSYSALIAAFIVCFAVAAIGSAFIISNLSPWYSSLAKPGFALPSWIFWPVQMMLYSLMAVSVWMVWETKAARSVKFPAFFIFGIQLLLNIAWPAVFFGAQSPGLGLIVIGVLVAAILATILSFYRINKWAFVLLLPHLVWVSYEMILNVAIWWLN